MIISMFGHGEIYDRNVESQLEQTITELAEKNEPVTFYCGTHGDFDRIARNVLKRLSLIYRNIDYYIVLAYLPAEKDESFDGLPTIFPEGIENVPKRFAINFRNNYMIENCESVLCYITHDWGNAAKFVKKAKKTGKTIINISKKISDTPLDKSFSTW